METVLGIVILVLNLVGVIGLGIAIEHWFKTLLGYIIALIIIAKINIDVIPIVLVVVAGITLIFLIFGIIFLIILAYLKVRSKKYSYFKIVN